MKTIILFVFPFFVYSQTVYLPATHPVYQYLDKMEAKQIIVDYRDAVKPLSRAQIAKNLMRIDTSNSGLTTVERNEFKFYMEEFHDELIMAGFAGEIDDRWHLYDYKSKDANFKFDFIAGMSYQNRADGKKSIIRSSGLMAYGNLGKYVGLSLMHRDNNISGTFQQIANPLTNIPANVQSPINYPTSTQYSIISAQASFEIGEFVFSAEMLPNTWGAGKNGTLILSDKAPAYPQVKLQFPIGEDISFTYIHGWLFSNLIDSLRSTILVGRPDGEKVRRVPVQKYIAAHIWEFTPVSGLDISVGESEIYGSRNPELIYLIPFMFFNGAERWLRDLDNSQMFFSLDMNMIPNHSYHFDLFVDHIATGAMFNPNKQRNQIGFTIGGDWYNIIKNDSRIMLEYTRTQPWIYNHKYPDATYQNHSINLGHWIGQNADLLSAGVWYRPLFNLEIGIKFESLRKGGKDSTVVQYRLPTPDFLYGPITKQQTFGIVGSYEPVRDLAIDFHILYSRFTTEVTSTSTAFILNPQEYLYGPSYSKKWDIFFGVHYNYD